MSQTLDQLIAARAVQAVGGGALVPVATAAASHLFEGHDRPRALGVIGALTFLGMAAGPFLGAAILDVVRPEAALARLGLLGAPTADFLAPAWRYVFYVNVPDRDRGPRPRLGGDRRLGHAAGPRPASTSSGRCSSRSPWARSSSA